MLRKDPTNIRPGLTALLLLFLSLNLFAVTGHAQDEAKRLKWNPPTHNEDGSLLTDLAGYKIYRNGNPLKDVGLVTEYPIVQLNLVAGTHRLTTTAYNRSGRESSQSNAIDAQISEIKKEFELTVQKSGSGSGLISSSPAGISCGSSCSAKFSADSIVQLSAVPESSATFIGWRGTGCSGTGSCQVTMDIAKNITAEFTLKAITNPPKITAHPQSISVEAGKTATFSCAFTPDSAQVQWLKNDAAISGATAATYARSNVTLSDNTSKYRCRVSNSDGTVYSNEAVLLVNISDPITTQTRLYELSGKVYLGSHGIANVRVSIGDIPVTTKLNGDYSFSNLAPGSYTLEAELEGYNLSPDGWSTPIVISSENIAEVNFIAQCAAGYIEIGGRCVPGQADCSSGRHWQREERKLQRQVKRLSAREARIDRRLISLSDRESTQLSKNQAAIAAAKELQLAAIGQCAEKSGSGVTVDQCRSAQRFSRIIATKERRLSSVQNSYARRKTRMEAQLAAAAEKTQTALEELQSLQEQMAGCSAESNPFDPLTGPSSGLPSTPQ